MKDFWEEPKEKKINKKKIIITIKEHKLEDGKQEI